MKDISSNGSCENGLQQLCLDHVSAKTENQTNLQRDPDGAKLESYFEKRPTQVDERHINRVISDLSSVHTDESSLYTLDDNGSLKVPLSTKLKGTISLQRSISELSPHRETDRGKVLRRSKTDFSDTLNSQKLEKQMESKLCPKDGEILPKSEACDSRACDLESGQGMRGLHEKRCKRGKSSERSICSNDCVIIEADEFEVDIAMDDFFREEEKHHLKNFSQHADRKEQTRRTKGRHFRWFGHGKPWTFIAILASWAGSALSILSRQSLAFVTVKVPVLVAPMYKPISAIGMSRVQICYNETVALKSGCEIVHLYTSDIDDNIFELSRLFLNSAILFGSFFTLMLTTSVFWESINLRPVGIGMLSSYFLQTLTMIFFDTTLCGEHKCDVDTGCVLCIAASLSWLAACVGTAKMDAFKLRAQRQRAKLVRQKAKLEIARQKELQRQITATRSDSCYSTSSSESSTPKEEPPATNDAENRNQYAGESSRKTSRKQSRTLSIMSCASTRSDNRTERLSIQSDHLTEEDGNEKQRHYSGLHEC